MYLADITGRNMSSADTYTNGRGLPESTPDGEAINASHTRKADLNEKTRKNKKKTKKKQKQKQVII